MLELQGVIRTAVSKSSTILAVVLCLAVTWPFLSLIYNIFFHPLRNVPGPLLQRGSPLPYIFQLVSGRQPFVTQKLHDKYGPVVRIAPNHVSFTDPGAWKEIYGHLVGSKAGSQEMAKTVVFNRVIDDIPTSIINADREEHGRFRRALAHGFSDSSMRQQEPIIGKYVDLLLRRIHEECDDGKNALNAEAWYNWTTFDITGDLIFGQTFGCLEKGAYHPWIEFIFATIKSGLGLSALSYLGFHWLVQVIFRNLGQLTIRKAEKYTHDLVHNRLAMKEGREDLFEGIVRKKDEWNLDFQKISVNAFFLVLAGSETTATALSGVTYFLLENPAVLEKLTQEVRSAFKSPSEINISSVNSRLPYMLAVLNEGLRMYPPITANLVRQVPPGGAQIAGYHIPEATFVEIQHWAMNHSKENWDNPWTFNPDRFLDGDNDSETNRANVLEALQAFSVGPRNCVGRNLAYYEMRLILARLVYDFDMKLADDSKDWVARQKTYKLWDRIPLNVYFTPVRRE